MSSATPCDFVSAMSMMTTSASSLSAMARATVAPTLPAPPTTVTFLFIVEICLDLMLGRSHAGDHRVGELGRADLGGPFHQSREVVRHTPRRDGAIHALDDEVRGLAPSEVTQHHFA